MPIGAGSVSISGTSVATPTVGSVTTLGNVAYVSGTGVPGATVNVSLFGFVSKTSAVFLITSSLPQIYANGTLVGSIVVGADGTYSLPSSALGVGHHDITATQSVGGVMSPEIEAKVVVINDLTCTGWSVGPGVNFATPQLLGPSTDARTVLPDQAAFMRSLWMANKPESSVRTTTSRLQPRRTTMWSVLGVTD